MAHLGYAKTNADSSAPAKPALDAETDRAVQSFMRHIAGRYRVVEALVFGSRARRTHRPDSDVDIAIVLDGPPGNRDAVLKHMAGVAFHVMMETGIMVEALPLWAGELEQPETFRNPHLIANIRREGVRI